MKILYGLPHQNIDVTEICYSKLLKDDIIEIPASENSRARIFSDPVPYTLKVIMIIDENNNVTNFSHLEIIKIDIEKNIVTKINVSEIDEIVNSKLANIHSKLKLEFGSFNEELPEQKMAIKYLTGNEKVLEIGGNIGRNSLVIASILDESENLVTLESSPGISNILQKNRELNDIDFNIETSALSNKKLIQIGWDTVPSDVLLDGYHWVNTINFQDLQTKYDIEFDTLVLDCEGAFYYILMDMPEILKNIKLVIMENDYHNIEHKQYVDKILKDNDFYIDYSEGGGWGVCYNNFFEVWKR